MEAVIARVVEETTAWYERWFDDYKSNLESVTEWRRRSEYEILLVVCPDGRIDYLHLFGWKPGAGWVLRVAGVFRDSSALYHEIAIHEKRARQAGKKLWVIETAHTRCAALGNEIHIGISEILKHQRVIRRDYPTVAHTPIAIYLEDWTIALIGPNGKLIAATVDAAIAIDKIESKEVAIAKLNGNLARNTASYECYPALELAHLFYDHVKAREGCQVDLIHREQVGLVGRGVPWATDNHVFAVTGDSNLLLLPEMGRSVKIGYEVVRKNTPPDEPVVWFCSATYNTKGAQEHHRELLANCFQRATKLKNQMVNRCWDLANEGRIVFVETAIDKGAGKFLTL